MRQIFLAPKHMLKMIGKNFFTNLPTEILFFCIFGIFDQCSMKPLKQGVLWFSATVECLTRDRGAAG